VGVTPSDNLNEKKMVVYEQEPKVAESTIDEPIVIPSATFEPLESSSKQSF
jgi:hypothetical protein